TTFRSPAQAQFWFEWQRKGWAMPASVIFGMVLGIVFWLTFSRDPKELVTGFVVGGGLLSSIGLVGGLICGSVGAKESDFELGHFLGTRPMKTAEMSGIILKTAAWSALLAWTTWAAAFLVLFAILFMTKTIPAPYLPDGVRWWYFPATLLGVW